MADFSSVKKSYLLRSNFICLAHLVEFPTVKGTFIICGENIANLAIKHRRIAKVYMSCSFHRMESLLHAIVIKLNES